MNEERFKELAEKEDNQPITAGNPDVLEAADSEEAETPEVDDGPVGILPPVHRSLNNPNRVRGKRVFGRNDPCPCGSGHKIKKCEDCPTTDYCSNIS